MKHGLKRHPLHPVWVGMRCRCNGVNASGYANYGGRGITVKYDTLFARLFVYGWSAESALTQPVRNGKKPCL